MRPVLYHDTRQVEIRSLSEGLPSRDQDFRSFDDTFRYPATSSRDLLRQLIADPYNRYALRDVLSDDLSGRPMRPLNTPEVIRQASWRIDAGRLALRPTDNRQGGIGGGIPGTPLPLVPPLPDTPTPPPDDTEAVNWITFQVIDDDTGAPLSDVPLKLKLSDGTVGTYTTDPHGRVHVPDLPDGTCDILEISDDEALEIVDVTPA